MIDSVNCEKTVLLFGPSRKSPSPAVTTELRLPH
jgi:hypothetical protein